MKNKYLSKIIILIVLLATSIGLFYSYETIQSHAQRKNNKDYVFQHTLNYVNSYNYHIKETITTNKRDYKTIIESHGKSAKLQEEISQQMEEIFDSYNPFEQKDILFTAIDTNTKKTLSNTNDNLLTINQDKQLQKKYQLYYQISFDKDGHLSLNYASQDTNKLRYDLQDLYTETLSNQYYINEDRQDYYQMKDIQNLTITYAVPQQLQPYGELFSLLNEVDFNRYFKYSIPYVIFAVIITFICVLCIPFSYLKEIKFLNLLAQIKFAILSSLWCIFTYLSLYFNYHLSYATLTNKLPPLFKEYGLEAIANYAIPMINIIAWFIFLGAFVVLAYMIKYLFHKGLKNYIKENTCIGWMYRNAKQMIAYILRFDLNNSVNKTVLKIVCLNFIIISFVSVFSVVFAFIYSVVIFLILKKKFDEIHDDYDVLLKATKQLSNGNFDYKINQDVGLFNPLKDEFSHIQDGFKKAVTEEVKSQRMKTELISNVSHDLKTPLTSIITYIDLLKNNQLDDEQRMNYIDILDRNSLRLKNLIDDLFEVSKVNSGDIHLDLIDVDIVALIKQAELECFEQLSSKGLDIKSQLGDKKVICTLDSSKTYRIFENLFMNISKYALENTRVYIDLHQEKDSVVITFKNISKDEMHFNENEIVERFVQGDKSRNTSGSGLGLAIVKSFTEVQGGTFHIELDGDLFKSIIRFQIKS